MMRKLMVVLLIGVICLLGITPVLAYNEAPMLKALVDADLLPPVEERLPEEPLVVPVIEEIGQYGGMVNLTHTGTGQWSSGGFQIIRFDNNLLQIAPDGTILPNLAKDWKISEDAKTVTLYLRKGIKWSDGVPFTADDLMFWWEDIELNDELTPVKPGRWCPGGEPMRMERIDAYTIRLHFAVPYPLVEFPLVFPPRMVRVAKHHMSQFHPRYASMVKLEKMVKEEGFDHWWQLFNRKMEGFFGPGPGAGVDFPTLRPYVLKQIKGENYLAERNPYYWKVDPAGNQLPYIDRVFIPSAGTGPQSELLTAKIIAGEVDLQGLNTLLEDYPLFMESAEKGNYRVLLYPNTRANECSIMFNLTYKEDLVLRDIFRDVRFRQAASLAIDREEINQTLYFGKAEPWQTTVLPSSSYYEEGFGKAYAQYNPEEANRLLDEMGLKWDKNDEWRLRPDGKKLTIIYEHFTQEQLGPIGELIKRQWKKIGINLIVKTISGDLMWTRYPANVVQMGVIWSDPGTTPSFTMNPSFHVPLDSGNLTSCTWLLWVLWFESGGKEGEEPPEEVKKNMERFEKMQTTLDKDEKIRLGKDEIDSCDV